MSDNIVIDQNKVQEWVALCEEGGNLRRSGASAETLAEINIRIRKALVSLISQNEADAEFLFQIINETPPQSLSNATTDPTDPTDPN